MVSLEILATVLDVMVDNIKWKAGRTWFSLRSSQVFNHVKWATDSVLSPRNLLQFYHVYQIQVGYWVVVFRPNSSLCWWSVHFLQCLCLVVPWWLFVIHTDSRDWTLVVCGLVRNSLDRNKLAKVQRSRWLSISGISGKDMVQQRGC